MRQDLLKQFIEFDLDMVRILLFLFGLIFKLYIDFRSRLKRMANLDFKQ